MRVFSDAYLGTIVAPRAGTMKLLFSMFGFSFSVGLLVACAAPSNEDVTAQSDNALVDPATTARACTVRRAFEGAGVGDSDLVTAGDLPAGVSATGATMLARMNVSAIGSVFVVELPRTTGFYDASGALLVRADLQGPNLVWFDPSGSPLVCPPVDAGPKCPSTAPIDATTYPYRKAQARSITTACTEQDLVFIRGNEDYRQRLTPACVACAYTSQEANAWGPLLTNPAGRVNDHNIAGCIEQVSESEACGRAYHQYKRCAQDACQDCDGAVTWRCLEDPKIATTACKDANTALEAACGEDLWKYRRACEAQEANSSALPSLRVACGGPLPPPIAPVP